MSARKYPEFIMTKIGIIALACLEGDLVSFNRERGYLGGVGGGGCFRSVRSKLMDMKYVRHEVMSCRGYWGAAYRRDSLVRGRSK